jgi:hypothetical protein
MKSTYHVTNLNYSTYDRTVLATDERELAKAVKGSGKKPNSINSLHLIVTGNNLNAALRSWVDDCIVPILVKEYLASLDAEKELAAGAEPVAEFKTTKPSSGEVTQ